ncbi:MAG TPA: efflux RND transporter permease subunit, partial [Bacteroidales bacterium]
LETPRVQEVNILSQDTWYKNQSYEYIIGFDKARLALKQISSNTFQYALSGFTKSDYNIASTIVNGQVENIKLASKQGNNIDKWQVMHVMAPIGNTSARLKNVSYLKKEPVSLAICKENQQYRLILAYDYIGDYMMSNNFQKRIIEEIEPKLPIGYSIKTNNDFFFWDTQSKKQYWLLFLVIAIIFFIGAVLFESLALPFAVILMIPISYIGLFLTFYLFEINFDQGGFAAFILLSGITVNAALYIINDYNNLRRKYKNTGRDPKMFYYKAFNYKITPILLIILSTALGLVPFLWGGQKEVFWPAMAAGTIGGLLFSMIGIVFYLPLLLKIRLKKIEFKSKK